MTASQLDKLRNTIVYLSDNVFDPTKTKILKLIYLCEEWSVKQFTFPFFGFEFYAWKFGPVQQDTYNALDPKKNEQIGTDNFLHGIISLQKEGPHLIIKPLVYFCDDEFSDNDILIMNEVIEKYKSADARDLVNVTHKKCSLWYNTVMKEDGLLNRFDKNEQSTSNHVLDFSELLQPEKKEIYHEDIDFFKFSNSLKK